MSSEQKPMQATPSADLEQQIMSPNIPKNEREHWAANEIHRLRDLLNGGCPMHPSASDQRCIDDQIIMAVDILSAAELHDVAAWIIKNATAIADRKIAEVSEPRKCVQTMNVFGRRLAVRCEEIKPACMGDPHGTRQNYCVSSPDDCLHHEPLYAADPPTPEPSGSDAVKEAIALVSRHPNCCGKRRCVAELIDSEECCRADVIRPVVAALAAAERKLAVERNIAQTAILSRDLAIQVRNKTGDQLRDAKKRTKDAEAYVRKLAVLLDEAKDTGAYEIATLTRKLATARGSFVSIIHDFGRSAELAHAAIAAIDAPAVEETERIKCSAIRKAGIVYEAPIAFADHDGKSPGASHFAVSQRFPHKDLLRGHDTGFVTTTGRYVDRKEGARIALAAGQIRRLHYQPDTLFSEDFNHPNDAPPLEPACAWLVCGKPESASCHRLCGRRMDESRQGEFCGDAGCHRFVPPEPANARGSEADGLPESHKFCGGVGCNMCKPPSARRFTAEEARQAAHLYDPANRYGATFTHYADLLDGDDALERAAVGVVNARTWIDSVNAMKYLRSILDQRAKGRQ